MDIVSTLIYSRRPVVRVLRHVIFWITDILSYLSVISINREINQTEVFSIVLKIIPIASITYLILYYLLPRTRSQSRGKTFLWIIALVLLVGVGMRLYDYYFVSPLLGIEQPGGLGVTDLRLAIRQIFSYMAIICMAITIKLIKNKSELEETNQQLLAEKKAVELNFLKAQMQPHFLFNTLNTLYSETIQGSEKAQQVVLHFSNLLRFILDECNKPSIELEKEIKVVKDFVALEKLRHGARLDVNMKIHDVNSNTMVSPLLFLPFVENCFKHTLTNQPGRIRIDIEIGSVDDSVHLIVQNDKIDTNQKAVGYGRGQGINNIKRQLDLLYGLDYTLTLDDTGDKYCVFLTIPMRNNGKDFMHFG